MLEFFGAFMLLIGAVVIVPVLVVYIVDLFKDFAG